MGGVIVRYWSKIGIGIGGDVKRKGSWSDGGGKTTDAFWEMGKSGKAGQPKIQKGGDCSV